MISTTEQSKLKNKFESLFRIKTNPQLIKSLETEANNTQAFRPTLNIIGSPVTCLPFKEQIETILRWGSDRLSKYVCVANVHMLTEAYWHPELSTVLHNADVVTPDGMPLVWMMRLLGVSEQDRVAGMDILLALGELAPECNIKIFFLGSEAKILEKMREKLEQKFPQLQIAGMEPLPFRPLTAQEDAAIIDKINNSGAGIVLLSLGCPKQEYWMYQHINKIQAVTIGLGGVFPVLAGIQKRAPLWVRELGLEWLYRLIQEPRRLWGRYKTTIPPFIWLAMKQLLTLKLQPVDKHESA